MVHNVQATAGDANKLAAEVAKADPWAMIDKIRNAKTKKAEADNDDAGQLATATAPVLIMLEQQLPMQI